MDKFSQNIISVNASSEANISIGHTSFSTTATSTLWGC